MDGGSTDKYLDPIRTDETEGDIFRYKFERDITGG